MVLGVPVSIACQNTLFHYQNQDALVRTFIKSISSGGIDGCEVECIVSYADKSQLPACIWVTVKAPLAFSTTKLILSPGFT